MKKIFYTIIFILICLAGFGVGEKARALEDDCSPPTSNICTNMVGDQPCPGERRITRGDPGCYTWVKSLGYSDAQAQQWVCCAPRPTITISCSDLIQPSGQGQTACYETSLGVNPCANTETALTSKQINGVDLCKTTTGAFMKCCVSTCSSIKNSGGQPGACKGVYNAQPTAAATQFCEDGETYAGIYSCLQPSTNPEVPSLQVCCLPRETGTVTGSGLLPGLLKCEDVVGASCKSRCATGETAYINNSLDPTVYGVEQSKACSDTQKCCYNPANNCTSTQSKGQCKETCGTDEVNAGSGFLDCFTGSNTERSWKNCCIPSGAASNTTTPPSTPSTTPTSTPNIPLAGTYRGGTTVGFEGLKGFGDIKISVLIGRIIQSALGIVGALALLMTVYGGLILLSSRGGEGVKKGKDILTWSIIGVAVILGSYALVSYAITGLGGGGAAGDTTFTGSPAGGTTTPGTTTPTTPTPTGADCRTAENGSCLLCQGTGSNPPTDQQKGDCLRYFTQNLGANSYASCDMTATGCADNQICCIPKAAPTPTSPQPDANGCYGTTATGYSTCTPGTVSGGYSCCDCGTAPGTTGKSCKTGDSSGSVPRHCGKGSYYCK